MSNGIVDPVALLLQGDSAARELGNLFLDMSEDQQGERVNLRQGVVTAVSQGSVDVLLSGQTVTTPSIPCTPGYGPRLGQVTWVLTKGPVRLAIGPAGYFGDDDSDNGRPPSRTLFRGSALSHTNPANWQVIQFDTNSVPPGSGITYAAGVFTIVTPGIYCYSAAAAFVANATGRRVLRVVYNGATVLAQTEGATLSIQMSTPTIYGEAYLPAGSTIQVEAYQNSGGNLAYVPGRSLTCASLRWVCF